MKNSIAWSIRAPRGSAPAGAATAPYPTFPAEPAAGVTPIAPMLAEMRRPIPPGFWPGQGGAPLPSGPPPGQPVSPNRGGVTSFDGAPGAYDLDAHAAQI